LEFQAADVQCLALDVVQVGGEAVALAHDGEFGGVVAGLVDFQVEAEPDAVAADRRDGCGGHDGDALHGPGVAEDDEGEDRERYGCRAPRPAVQRGHARDECCGEGEGDRFERVAVGRGDQP
jgi:hypothetical protein